jgi:hypothetical protein
MCIYIYIYIYMNFLFAKPIMSFNTIICYYPWIYLESMVSSYVYLCTLIFLNIKNTSLTKLHMKRHIVRKTTFSNMVFLSLFFSFCFVGILYLFDGIGVYWYYVNMNLFPIIVLVEFCNY